MQGSPMVYLSSIYESMQEKLTAKVYLSVAVAEKQLNERRMSSSLSGRRRNRVEEASVTTEKSIVSLKKYPP